MESDKTQKPTNPKDLIGSSKLPLHLWPTTATAMGCIGLLNGALKYGRTNWRESGVRASIYIDAAKRHLDAWFEGEECDPDDGVPHLSAALACIAIIVDAKAAEKLNDDRAYNGDGYRKLVEDLTPHVDRLKALHAGKEPKHLTVEDGAQGDDEGWIKWGGGNCPVGDLALVSVKVRNGKIIQEREACLLIWSHILGSGDIIAYKVVKT